MKNQQVKIKSALISVFHKDGLEDILAQLHRLEISIFSTGGTYDFIKEKGYEVSTVEDLTSYPSILGGRVKTLHPKVFGGILNRRTNEKDMAEVEQFDLPSFDLVIVDLYPFEETVKASASIDTIIEKIDIGGVSLIRAAAKNFTDVLVISKQSQYKRLTSTLSNDNGITDIDFRRVFAKEAFLETSHYDAQIAAWFSGNFNRTQTVPLRYGENPHQRANFKGNLGDIFSQINGKELSYNNLVDIDSALSLLIDLKSTACVIVKHTNPCGVALGTDVLSAWKKALACDPISAFGGVIAINAEINEETANAIDEIFFEILIAPSFSEKAKEILSKKKNRIILELKSFDKEMKHQKTILNGILEQDTDLKVETEKDFQYFTDLKPSDSQIQNLLFANTIAKHTKSNTIVICKDSQLLGIGVGQTSRVDALKQALLKADSFGFDVKGASMASDAFFPFPDCVEIAHKHGINSVIQPGGSIKDSDSIDYCNQNGISMVLTGFRHFKH